jgi:hypothetical protein
MDLTAEEQSFFDAGQALDDEQTGGEPAAPTTIRRHRSRRRSRRSAARRTLRKLRTGGWGKAVLSLLLTAAAVWAGYWASMYVVNRDLPSPSELGVETRQR